ncbi:DUF222 domain-containing protein, partial [Miniimonas arenae]
MVEPRVVVVVVSVTAEPVESAMAVAPSHAHIAGGSPRLVAAPPQGADAARLRDAVTAVRTAVAGLADLVRTLQRSPVSGAGASGLGPAGLDGVSRDAAAVNAARLGEVAPDTPAIDPTALTESLSGLDSAVSVLGLARAGVLGLVKQSDGWHRPGAERRDFTGWRTTSSRQSRGATRAEENLTHALADLPEVGDAVREGVLTIGHVQAMGDVLASSSERARASLTENPEELVDLGRRLPVPQLRRALQQAAAAIDADAADKRFDAARDRRFVRMSAGGGGVHLTGFLDPVAGGIVRAALDAVTPVPAVDDTRTGDQRRADALTDLASRTLGYGQRTGAQVRPHVSILVREDTWLLLMERRRLRLASCRDGGSQPGPGATGAGATGAGATGAGATGAGATGAGATG